MALIEVNKNPNRRDLLVFSLLFPVFGGLVGAIIYWRFEATEVAKVVWAVGLAVGLLTLAIKPLRKPIYLGWIYLTLPIGLTISWTLLTLIYFLVFAPVGLMLRLAGKDPMERRLDPRASTYWRPHRARSPSSYFRQF